MFGFGEEMASESLVSYSVLHFAAYDLVSSGLDILITCKSGIYRVPGYFLTLRRSSSLLVLLKRK